MYLNISLLCISVLQSHCQHFYLVGVYIFTVAKRSKPLAFEQVKCYLKPWLRNGNVETQKLRLKQTVVNTEVPCTARTVLRERSKHTSQDLESIGKVEKSW